MYLLGVIILAISENFVKYDYGTEKNMAVYNAPRPPAYNLSNSKAPVAIFHAPTDYIVTKEVSKIFPIKEYEKNH